MIWEPVSAKVMRHILEQVADPRQLTDAEVAREAQRFLVPQSSPLHFAIHRRVLGETTVSLTTLSAMRILGNGVRTPGSMYISFVLSGLVTVTAEDGEKTQLKPGIATALSGRGSFDTESVDGTRYLQIMLPESRLQERGVRVHHGRFMFTGKDSLRLPLRNLALAVADPAWVGSSMGTTVAGRTIEDLIVGMFLEADAYALASEDLRAALRARAISEIDAQHRRPELSPALVAEGLAVSLRHLQRAFEHSGVSIAGTITARRAETAATLLTAPESAVLTIDEIAHRSGFTSAFEFRAAFKSVYGVLPSAYRAAR